MNDANFSRRIAATLVAGLGANALVTGCGASTRLVPAGPHPPHLQEFVTVTFPPPPAEIEEIPQAVANPSCAWVDGHYNWDGRRWSWENGRWVIPPAGCYYAAPVLAWSKSGEERLYYTPPRWYPDDAASLSERAAQCPAALPCPK